MKPASGYYSYTSRYLKKTNTIKLNSELEQMMIDDQEMRMSDSDEPMEPKDKIHRQRVMELLSKNLIRTPIDKFNAALILQLNGYYYTLLCLVCNSSF